MTAVKTQNIPLVKLLIRSGVRQKTVDKETGNTPLHIVVAQEDTTILQLLLAAKAEVNVANNREKTPLDIALSKGLRKIAAKMRGMGVLTSVELGAASSLRVQLVDAAKK